MLKRLLRLAAFLLCCLLAIVLSNIFLIRTDTFCALNLQEMRVQEDIELAIVGSSIVRDHFNQAIIREKTGLKSFSVAIPSASMQADIASTKELFDVCSPEWIVLVTEPYAFTTAREDTESAYRLMPYIRNPKTLVEYYLQACQQDGYYLDRLLTFREFGATSFSDVARTFGMRFFPAQTYEKLKTTIQENGVYMGLGFVRHPSNVSAKDLIRQTMLPEENEYTNYPDSFYHLLPPSEEMLLEYKALCEAHGAKLIVLMYPNLTVHALNEPEFLPYTDCVGRFCRDNDIPYFNFLYAKRDYLPCLDGYYTDLYHMNGEGADILSEVFSDFFLRYTAGEALDDLFYANRYQYLDSIDFITNVWLTREADGSFSARCNRGTYVEPEYRFALRDETGMETPLGAYSPEAVLSDAPEIPKGCDLRVYARPAGREDVEPVYYDWPTDYEAYIRD